MAEAEAEMEVSDPEGCLCAWSEQAKAGASPRREAGAGGGPREPSPEEEWEDLSAAGPTAPGDPPPAPEPGSRTGSDIDSMSKDVLVEYLCCKFKAVSMFPDPEAREFLKDKLLEAKAFAHRLEEHSKEVAKLKAEKEHLKQKLQEAKSNQWARNILRQSKTDFHIQVLVRGKTGGCENKFLKQVSQHLSNINLKIRTYQEGSGHFLLVFCPVSSRVGTDMANALEDLKGEPKAVLVMLHHKLKESTSYVDTKPQAQHPAVVRTVHARYTLDDGFYACPMNEETVAIVANVLENHCNVAKGDPAVSGTSSKFQITQYF